MRTLQTGKTKRTKTMTSPTVTALCGIVIVVLHGCFAVEPVTTGGQLWLSGSGVNGMVLKAAMARTLHNVPRLSKCAFHCRQLSEACASFFYNELASTCTLCKADRCNRLDIVEGAQNPNIIFFSRMTWSSCPLGRGYRYYSDVNLCIRYCSTPLWWVNARRSCAMDGGHVIYINSQAEYELMKDFINEWMVHLRDDKGKDITTAIYNRLWLGGHRSATTGKWVWGDGTSAEAFLGGKWSSGQPTAKDSLAISTFDNFSMLALDYNYQYLYICEIDVVQ